MNIDLEQLIRGLNLLIALLCLYPALNLLRLFWTDRTKFKNGERQLNTSLLGLFLGITLLAIVNSILYLIGILGQSGGHYISIFRSTVTNVIFLWVTWQMYLIHKRS